jgi:mannonate dehydratase
VAESCGVSLALHPDDPPIDRLRGQDRIITSFAACERAVALVPSPANGICYCQGTFASAGEDVVEGIKRLAPHIRFGHFRDVAGSSRHFRETFQDNGQTDMAAAIHAWLDIGFEGPLRPDHVPTLDGESNENPGYEMLGRLWAVGYMRGLLDATRATPPLRIPLSEVR